MLLSVLYINHLVLQRLEFRLFQLCNSEGCSSRYPVVFFGALPVARHL